MGYNLVNPLITIWGLFSHPIYLNIVLLGCLLIGFIYHIDPLTVLRNLRFWCLNTTGYIWRHVVWRCLVQMYMCHGQNLEQISPIGCHQSIGDSHYGMTRLRRRHTPTSPSRDFRLENRQVTHMVNLKMLGRPSESLLENQEFQIVFECLIQRVYPVLQAFSNTKALKAIENKWMKARNCWM